MSADRDRLAAFIAAEARTLIEHVVHADRMATGPMPDEVFAMLASEIRTVANDIPEQDVAALVAPGSIARQLLVDRIGKNFLRWVAPQRPS